MVAKWVRNNPEWCFVILIGVVVAIIGVSVWFDDPQDRVSRVDYSDTTCFVYSQHRGGGISCFPK